MTASIPESLPQQLIAGDTWQWTRSLSDYPAGTWTATVYFESMNGTFNVVGTASSTDHSFTISAASTAAIKAGQYQWRLRVTSGGVTMTVESGWIEVLADPAAAGKRDVRSWARRTLDAIEAFLEGNATTAQQSMSIQGRTISRWPLLELMQLRDKLRLEVRVEERGASAAKGRVIKVRLSHA